MFDTKLSVIVPAYNEEQAISNFIYKCLNLGSFFSKIEIIVVNDGSVDGTQYIVEEISKDYSSVILINLATNSGHMAALTAGFKRATGEWIATVDADGQDNPMIILEMYEKCIGDSADICFSRRKNRKQDSFIHKFFSPLFYKVITRATNGDAIYQSADFRLISNRVLTSLNMLPEVNRMYRVLIPAMGYKSVIIDYERNIRNAGKSKYNFKSLLNLGIRSILATTGAPLRWVSLVSLFSAFFALAISSIALIQGLFYNSVPGWASISFIISAMFFLQSITNLVISEFLLILIADVRQRPTYQLAK
jgi:dolichol-phosphate mannosyltransferase